MTKAVESRFPFSNVVGTCYTCSRTDTSYIVEEADRQNALIGFHGRHRSPYFVVLCPGGKCGVKIFTTHNHHQKFTPADLAHLIRVTDREVAVPKEKLKRQNGFVSVVRSPATSSAMVITGSDYENQHPYSLQVLRDTIYEMNFASFVVEPVPGRIMSTRFDEVYRGCKVIFVVVTENLMDDAGVKQVVNSVLSLQLQGTLVVPLRLGQAEVPICLSGLTWIECDGGWNVPYRPHTKRWYKD